MIAIYHSIKSDEEFDECAKQLLELIYKAEETSPGVERALYVDIEGHRNALGGFDKDMLELQTAFAEKFLMQYLTEINMPLMHLKNKKKQINEVPHALLIKTL